VPDPLECLLVVPAGAGCVADDRGIEAAAAGERQAEFREFLAPAGRVAAQCVGGERESSVVFD
jgi:hypothetical protein